MKKKEKSAKKAPAKVTSKKPAKRVEAKKATAKKAAAKKATSAKQTPAKKAVAKKAPAKKPIKKEVNYRTYHLVKRSDGMWEVKYAGGQKAIKLFRTQKEALAYSEKMAENQGGAVLVHNSKGSNKGRIQKR